MYKRNSSKNKRYVNNNMKSSFALAIMVIFVFGLLWWSTIPNNYYENENYVGENYEILPKTQDEVPSYMIDNNSILAADNGAFELLGVPDQSTEQEAYNLSVGMGAGIYQTMGSRAESSMMGN